MDSDIEFDEQEPGRNPLRERMKQLESENAALKAKAEQAAEAERELAFVKAGIDPNSPMAKYFMRGYEGDLDPEAIKAAALEAQLLSDGKPAEKSADASAWERTNQAASGNTAGEPPVDYFAKIAQAESPAELEKWLTEARNAQASS